MGHVCKVFGHKWLDAWDYDRQVGKMSSCQRCNTWGAGWRREKNIEAGDVVDYPFSWKEFRKKWRLI